MTAIFDMGLDPRSDLQSNKKVYSIRDPTILSSTAYRGRNKFSVVLEFYHL